MRNLRSFIVRLALTACGLGAGQLAQISLCPNIGGRLGSLI
jgi:hypothetical protein